MDQGLDWCLVRMCIRVNVSMAVESPDYPIETLSSGWSHVCKNFQRFIMQTKAHSCLKIHGTEVQHWSLTLWAVLCCEPAHAKDIPLLILWSKQHSSDTSPAGTSSCKATVLLPRSKSYITLQSLCTLRVKSILQYKSSQNLCDQDSLMEQVALGLLALSNTRRANTVILADEEGPRWLAAALASSGHCGCCCRFWRRPLPSGLLLLDPIMNKYVYRWGPAGHSDICVYHWAAFR